MSTTATKPRRKPARRSARGKASPLGTTQRTQRVTAVLGSKPNSLTWRQYHAIAQHDPWSLDAIRVNRYRGPVALTPARRITEPGRRLTPAEQLIVRTAHDDLAAGRIGADDYLAALAPLGVILDQEATR